MEPLTPEQVRVLGCLLEKEATVPDTYPMTLNGLRQACNQSSSREPVVDYAEATVQRTLDDLKALGLVRFVHPSHGARSTKFRHVLDERLLLERDELAVLGVLALRGPQTAGELRTRTERWHGFESLDEVETTLTRLAERDTPLTVELPREPGRHQRRWMHLLGGPDDVAAAPTAPTPDASGVDAAASHHSEHATPDRRAVAADDVVAELTATVADLAARVERLERELGMS